MTTILVDTREQRPYDFADSVTATLETGDYTTEGVNAAIERKTPSDFLNSITHDRDRFEAECERAEAFDKEMIILVEAPRSYFEEGEYHRDVHPNSVIGTVDAWSDRYNVRFVFAKNRQTARQFAKETLQRWQGGTVSKYV